MMLAIAVAAPVLGPGLGWAQAPDGAALFAHGNDAGAMPCAACHGVAAQGNASIGAPKLAGLPAAVITGYLQQFAAGNGGNASMQMVAKALSPAEVQAVAGYLASLK